MSRISSIRDRLTTVSRITSRKFGDPKLTLTLLIAFILLELISQIKNAQNNSLHAVTSAGSSLLGGWVVRRAT